MIETLTGIIKRVREQMVFLAIGPVEIAICTPTEVLFTLDSQVTIYTYIHWNQEQGPTLYGFVNEIDRKIFLLVISCSGLGPRIGLAILRDLGAPGFVAAIESNDERMLSKVNGIGLKKAEQMIVQLKHKVAHIEIPMTDGVGQAAHWHTVQDALGSLHYSKSEITRAIAHIKQSSGNDTFDQLFRKALSFLSKQSQ